MGTKLLRLPQVMEKVGLKKTAIYDKIKNEGFPAPVKLGSASAWVESEVDDWLEAYIAEFKAAG